MTITPVPFGGMASSAWANELVAAVNRVGGSWRRAANQSLASGSFVPITWDTEDADTNGLCTPSSSTITIPAGFDGVWHITASVIGLVGTAPTIRVTTRTVDYDAAASLSSSRATISIALPLAAADTITVSGIQNSGSAANVTGRVHVYRVGL